MNHLAISSELASCISNCTQCHLICLNMATGHCLDSGGPHTEPEHLRTMLVCAEVCRLAAYVMTTGSTLHRQSCALCADVCDACIASCRDLDGMEECVAICQRCKESCEAMSAS